jgi:nucleotide-binding universal stress UspA family protein
MSVIAGIDFSEPSARAARIAASIAGRRKVPLVLLHALPAEYETEVARAAAARRATERLEQAAAELRGLAGTVEAEVVPGLPDEVLAAEAERRKADVLVVGALGRRLASRWKLGTTAERTAQSSRVPVLVVRDSRPLESWLRGEQVLRVLIGTDVADVSETAITWAGTLRDAGPVELVVAHVYSPPEAQRRLGFPVSASLFDRNPEIEEALERALVHRVWGPAGPGGARIEIRPGAGRVGDHLADLAEELRADLVVVGNHRRVGVERLWHGSVSQRTLHVARSSVAVVPGRHGASARRPRRFLVGVDFSSASERAAQQAFAMASYGCTVWLVHVRGKGAPADEVMLLRQRLQRLVPFDAAATGLTVEAQVVDADNAGQAIVQSAEQTDADLIILGTRGLTGLRKAVLGSVSEAVVGGTRRPVLLVHDAEA